MGIRMSGINSGLDTDAIVKALMTAQTTKKTKIENKITKHEWKQEKWKDLNSKIYSFYTGSLTKLKTQGTYTAKKASTSNDAKVSVSASNNAIDGTHSLSVSQLASSQYVTGKQLDSKVTTATKLVDALEMTEGDTITIASGKKSYDFVISEDSTLNDFLSACKSVGLNASYDTNQKRLFINSAASGADNAFSITSSGATEASQLYNSIRNQVGYSSLSVSERLEMDKTINSYINAKDGDAELAAYEKLLEKSIKTTTTDLIDKLTKYYNGSLDFDKDKDVIDALSSLKDISVLNDDIDNAVKSATEGLDENSDKYKAAVKKAISDNVTAYLSGQEKEFRDGYSSTGNIYNDLADGLSSLLSEYKAAVTAEEGAAPSAVSSTSLSKIGLSEISYNAKGTVEEREAAVAVAKEAGVSLVTASNSKIIYNGAEMESSSNTVTANGLTFTAKDVTAAGETINLTVSRDTSAIYDTVKSILKEYNSLLDELNNAYGAESAKGYEPLTDEEREAMSEDQITKWEDKIKDSLLRRDSTLENVIQSMKNTMTGSIQYNGKSYSLSSFGISTKYYTEKGKLHIAGDSDDPLTADDTDKLKKAIEEDPDAVMSVLSGLAQKLYDDVGQKMKSSTLSSAFTIYNDKKMSKDLTQYKDDLKKMETKLKDLEDRYYKQFTAMEKALSTLNSQSNSMNSLLGVSSEQ